MKLAESLLVQLEDASLSRDEQMRLRCQAAAELERRGQYEAAREALGDLWRGVGQRPALEGLSPLTAAEVLLRAGTLSGWFGSARQIEDGQDTAKDLISESISRFRAIGENTRAAVAQSELGFCYKRLGAYDEARVVYQEALKGLEEGGPQDLRAEVLKRLAVVELHTGRYNDALRVLTDAADLFDGSDDDALKGKFHNDLACVLTCLSRAERRMDYADRAIIEYTAAAHHFELAGHTSYCARAENNLGFLLYTIRQYDEAHEHLGRARRRFVSERDEGGVAQVDETRARVLLAEGRAREAARVISESVRTLEKGGEQAMLAEALITQGRVLAGLGDATESQNVLRRAADLAEQAGAVEDAGRALLTLIEEHADRVGERDLLETYSRADGLLKGTQDAETIARLRGCAARVVSARLLPATTQRDRSRIDFWANFNLTERVRAYEAQYISRALTEAHGSVTHAARLLGLNHHTKLAAILAGRHKDLLHLRTPPEKRRRSIIRVRYGHAKAACKTKGGAHPDALLRAGVDTAVTAAPAPVEIETARLRLRRFLPSDLDALAALMADPDVMRFIGREAGRTLSPAEAEELLALLLAEWDRRGFGRFVVQDKGTGQFIGLCGWKTFEGAADKPELLYLLRKEHWGRGLAVEAAAACLRYGFGELGMTRVVALTRPDHRVSRRVLEQLGMSCEGEGVYYGVRAVCYAVTRAEFRPDAAARYKVHRR